VRCHGFSICGGVKSLQLTRLFVTKLDPGDCIFKRKKHCMSAAALTFQTLVSPWLHRMIDPLCTTRVVRVAAYISGSLYYTTRQVSFGPEARKSLCDTEWLVGFNVDLSGVADCESKLRLKQTIAFDVDNRAFVCRFINVKYHISLHRSNYSFL